MKRALFVPLIWLLLLPNVHGEAGWDSWGVHFQAAGLLAKGDFEGLERLAAELKKKGYDIRQDETELGAFYGGLKVTDDGTDQAWNDRLAVLNQWQTANPDSLTARIAIANWYIGYAWRARGTGYANTITPQGEDTMDKSITKAASILRGVSDLSSVDDPEFYDDWMEVCQLQGDSKEVMFDYLKKGTDLAREYEPIYMQACDYLLERWYGQPGEREQWMKTWADQFPGTKGDVFYGNMLAEEAAYFSDDVYKKGVDYDRAKNGFEERLKENDPDWMRDENTLSYLAMAKGDRPVCRQTLIELEGAVDVSRYATDTDDGTAYYKQVRRYYDVEGIFDGELAVERYGLVAEAEKFLLSLPSHPVSYRPLADFYERQGMEEKLLAMQAGTGGKTYKQMADEELSNASPEDLAELVAYYAMMGDWAKAEVGAKRFEEARPMNMIGKNMMLLCAVRNGDTKREQAMINTIATFKTDRAIYLAAQSVLSGQQTWEQASQADTLKKSDPYLSQGITAIALYYMAKGQTDEARTVIEQSLPNCTDNSGKVLLQSLLFGSVGKALKFSVILPLPPATSPVVVAGPSVSGSAAAMAAAAASASPSPSGPVSLPPTTGAIAAAAAAMAGPKIVLALWGSGEHFVDVTDKLRGVMAQPAGNFRVNPKTMNGDPTPGRKKTLMTVVGLGSYRSIVATPQGGRIDLGALKGMGGE